MIIRYTTCDGITKVDEEITLVEVCQDLLPPHDVFLRCYRSEEDYFEIYDLTKVDFIQA